MPPCTTTHILRLGWSGASPEPNGLARTTCSHPSTSPPGSELSIEPIVTFGRATNSSNCVREPP